MLLLNLLPYAIRVLGVCQRVSERNIHIFSQLFVPVWVVFSLGLRTSLLSYLCFHSLILTAVVGNCCVEIFISVDFYWLGLSTEVILLSYDHSCKTFCVVTCTASVCALRNWSVISGNRCFSLCSLFLTASLVSVLQVYKILVTGPLEGSWVIFRSYEDFCSLKEEVRPQWVRALKSQLQLEDHPFFFDWNTNVIDVW